MSPPAAITGWAWRTPLGATVDGVVERLLRGERAVATNGRFDAASYPCSVAALVPGEPAPSKHARFLRRLALFGHEVAREALAASGAGTGVRLGLFAAVGGLRAHWDELMPALSGQERDAAGSWARGLGAVHPFWMLRHLSNNAHALLAAELPARGDGATFGGASAGAMALASAARALAEGAIDAAVVVAYDSLLDPETIVELGSAGALFAGDGAPAAPYDLAAAGAVPGEAAAAVVLEPLARAGRRALVLVDAAAGAGAPAGEPHADVIRRIAARLSPGACVVDGAGRALPALDLEERLALGELLGAGVPLSATSAAFGRTGAAAPLLQTIVLGALLRRGELAPIAGLVEPASAPLRPLRAREATSARIALCLSTGAPGLVAAVRVELPGEGT